MASTVCIGCPVDNRHAVRVKYRVAGDTLLETRVQPGTFVKLHVDFETRLVIEEVPEICQPLQ